MSLRNLCRRVLLCRVGWTASLATARIYILCVQGRLSLNKEELPMQVIDGDSHFMEPLDLFERYIDPQFREQAMRVVQDPATGKPALVVEGRQLHILNVEELLAAVVGYGQKEEGRNLSNFDPALMYNAEWQNMTKRV